MATSTEATQIPAIVSDVVRRRRVAREFRPEPIPRSHLELLVEAGCYAPTGGNRRPVRFVAVQSAQRIREILAASPGILGRPPALIALCLDWAAAPHLSVDDPRTSHSLHVDIGAAMQNILLMAEALDLGAGPVMSFHRRTVRSLLGLPEHWSPIIMIVLGSRTAPTAAAPQKTPAAKIEPFTVWVAPDDESTDGSQDLAASRPRVHRVRDAILELMTYLAAAARGNVDESSGYGPLRLLEGAQRAAWLLSELGVQDEELSAYHNRITQDAMKILASPELTRSVADELLTLLAERTVAARQGAALARQPVAKP